MFVKLAPFTFHVSSLSRPHFVLAFRRFIETFLSLLVVDDFRCLCVLLFFPVFQLLQCLFVALWPVVTNFPSIPPPSSNCSWSLVSCSIAPPVNWHTPSPLFECTALVLLFFLFTNLRSFVGLRASWRMNVCACAGRALWTVCGRCSATVEPPCTSHLQRSSHGDTCLMEQRDAGRTSSTCEYGH